MTSIGRLWRTARHLRWEQLALRPLHRLRTPTIAPRAPPPVRPLTGPWIIPPARAPSLVGPAAFSLLGETRALDDVGWDNPRVPLLWRYHQHYFDDLTASGAATRATWHAALVQRWLAENPPPRGTAWAPYPTSLRLVNWIKWLVGGAVAGPRVLESLAHQTRWLRARLEWHVLGNHLFVNAKALVLAGRFFTGDEADAWTAQGVAILTRELPEQILEDGGQFERSPMYQALALEDVLDLVNIVRASGSAPPTLARFCDRLCALAPRMHRWLRLLTHPDATLVRFNDTADGIAPPVSELDRYAAALGLAGEEPTRAGLTPLFPSGYVRAAFGDAVAFLDVAPVAPDYLMAHGHADTLSFELSLRGRRLIVNGGTSRYGTDAERVRERGTAAHSTVVVDGQDSSEVWSGFRVGRRARVHDVTVGASSVAATHDGYAHLRGAPRHTRTWTFTEAGMTVDDAVRPAPRTALARFHLASGLHTVLDSASTARVVDGEREVARVTVTGGRVTRGLSRTSPSFGVVVPGESLDVELVDGRATTAWTWA